MDLGWDAAVITYTPKSVRLATAAVLPANTAAGAGVGATLTMDAVGILTIDGGAVLLNDRVFVHPDHAGAADRAGIYLCTTEGTAGAAAVLTRATDFDQAAAGEIELGVAVRPTAGTANVGKTYVLTTTGAITVDTTNLAFTTYASGAALATRYSKAMALWPRASEVSAIVDIVALVTSFAGSLSLEVVNATPDEIRREEEGTVTLPWEVYPNLSDMTGTITVTAGVITIAGTMNFPIDLEEMKFTHLRFKWVGTLGAATITLRVSTRDKR